MRRRVMAWGLLMGQRVMKVKASRGVRRTGGGMCGVMRGKVVLEVGFFYSILGNIVDYRICVDFFK
jgi:hypothetical protein